MEEFDLNFDNNIGTSVSKLKNNINNNSESEIDYDKILDKLDITETNDIKLNKNGYTAINNKINNNKINNNKINNNNNNINNNNINMNHFAKKLENKLDNIKKERNQEMFVDMKRPSVKMDDDSIKLAQKDTKPSNPVKKSLEEPPQVSNKFEHKDIIIYVVLFIILNSKILIELIYDKISIARENPYPNLIIRALVFGVLLFLIKKLNLNS